ncbi:MAG: TonB family protein, partial [Bacteroidales bacterium]|nr:TonB family protein [Bacteroidales bacterium]
PLPRIVAAFFLLAALLLAFGTTARPRFVPFAAERDGIGLLEDVVITKYATAGTRASAIRTESHVYPLRKTPGITSWGELPVKPIFSPGLHAWAENNLAYPENCMKQGRVEVTFTIDAEGLIKDIALVQGVCPELDDAVLTLVRDHFPLSLPAAGRDSAFVASQCILPVTFRIRTDRQRKVDERVAVLRTRWTALPLNEVDEKPVFKDGGMKEFTPWILSQLTCPDDARAWRQASGKRGGAVVCRLTVTRTGRVKRVSLLRGSGSPMDAEILRVVRASPKWERPAYKDGKPAAVRMNIPVIYQIPDD